MKKQYIALLLLAASATPAHAAGNSVTGEFEYTGFSDGFGHLAVGSIWSNIDLGSTTIVAGGSIGERDFRVESHSGVEGKLSVYHDWNDVVSTRTTASFASDDVVFARHSIEQDFNFKLLPKTVFLAGIKHVAYDHDIKAVVLSAGATRYFKGGLISYRYNLYDLDDLANTHSHMVSTRLNDGHGNGFTQLWVSRGTSLQEVDVAAVPFKGHATGVALRRVQPLGGGIDLNMTLGGSWFDTEFVDYNGITAKGGLTVSL